MKSKIPLVVGQGKDMQFNPPVWEKWQSDACDRDMWKHGRISDPYRDNYDKIKWNKPKSKGGDSKCLN